MKFKTYVWEDNAIALNLENIEPGRFTPISKHYSVKFHWFCSYVKPKSIAVNKIETKEKKVDILTKGLQKATFKNYFVDENSSLHSKGRVIISDITNSS